MSQTMGFNIHIIDKQFYIENLIDNKNKEYLFSYFNTMKTFLKDYNTKKVDLVILNLIVNDCDYNFFIKELHKFNSIPIILLATTEQKELVNEMISLGCSDVIFIDERNLSKKLNKTVSKYIKKAITMYDNSDINSCDFEKIPEILFADKKTKEVFKVISKIAKTDISILIQGENGVGKEIYARRIHEQSNRKNGPFIVVNSAMLANENIDNILFGYYNKEKKERIAGKFESANGGTIYLDEIGDLKLDIQAKILRILQEKELEIYETNEIVNLDFRIISSTNKDLFAEIKKVVLAQRN
jgi:DNA-binding NtrC family response regulator